MARQRFPKRCIAFLLAATFVVSCGSSKAVTTTTGGASATTTAGSSTTSAAPKTTGSGKSGVLDSKAIVSALASDALQGRDNLTPGSLAAQELLIGQVSQFARPAFPDAKGNEGFLQHFAIGANILAVIPGGELADQYVIIGAHYDHLGTNCKSANDDRICNGATDNATGVAAAISVARSIAAAGVPRRSVVLALWDGEEDNLAGSAAYLASPLVPVARTTSYVNFDIQGADVLPNVKAATIAVGTETGGPNLIAAFKRAATASTLNTVPLSLLFGEGRSDHANFVKAGIPSVFFTDATGPCYHTAQDEVSVVDFPKLDQEIITATALSRDLVATNSPAVLDRSAPASTYTDAVSMLALTKLAQPNFGLLDAKGAESSAKYVTDLQAIVDAGPAAFNDAAVATVLKGAIGYVAALNTGKCQSYAG